MHNEPRIQQSPASSPGKAATPPSPRPPLRRPSLGPPLTARTEPGFPRDGFTLVELLVVIVIIIILMGLLTPVLVNVMVKARESRIIAEISAMDGAFKAYKERYGSYPPSDFTNATQLTSMVAAHLAHAFPRCNVQSELASIPAITTPAQALVFWLSGFSPDPEHPISGSGTKTPFYNFDTTRLTGTPPVYSPIDGLGAPYLYFAAQNYATQAAFSAPSGQGTGIGRPYLLDNGSTLNPTNPYVNPNSFQIISAGLDGDYGDSNTSAPSFPSGTNYTLGDNDNLTNFSDKNLKDAVPH